MSTIREHHEKTGPFVVYDVQPRSLWPVDKLLIIQDPPHRKRRISTKTRPNMPEGLHPDFAPNTSPALWQACLDELSGELPEQQFNTWIKPLVAQVSDDQNKLTLFVANRFKMDWIRAQYAQKLSQILERLQGQPVQIELALTPRESPVRSARPAPTALSSSSPEVLDMPEEAPSQAFRSRLNPALTFDTLVEGSANRMARAAAMHVASSPGQLYNPLFIYGGVGLGKTHLVHAVGNTGKFFIGCKFDLLCPY